MPENKQYFIQMPGIDGLGKWGAETYEQKKHSLFKKHPEATVMEFEAYNGSDPVEDNDMFHIVLDGFEGEGKWDAKTFSEKKDKLFAKHPNAKVYRSRGVDYWYNKAIEDDESIKAMKAELETLNSEPDALGLPEEASYNPYDPELSPKEYAEFESQYQAKRERREQLEASIAETQAAYDANPRVIEANARYEAEYAAALEEYKKNYLPNLRKQIIGWKGEDVDALTAAKGASKKHNYGAGPHSDASIWMAAFEGLSGEDAGEQYLEASEEERYNSALAFLNKAERIRESHTSVAEGLANSAMNQIEAWGSQSDIETYTEIYGILSRLESELGTLDNISEETLTQHLSRSEQALILAFFEYNAAREEVEDSTRWEYKAGEMMGDAVPFILEFITTGGITKAATKGATKGLSKALTSWIKGATKGSFKRTARNVVAKGTRGAVQGLAQAAMITPLRPTAYANVAKSMTQIGEDGRLKDSAADIAVAVADEYIETLSELSGGTITKMLGVPTKWVGGKIFGKETFDKWANVLLDNKVTNFIKMGGIHNYPVEMAEEYFGNAIREIYDHKALDRMHEGDNFLAMAVGFAPMTLLGMGAGYGQYAYAKHSVSKNAAKLRDILLADGFDKNQVEHLVNFEKELTPESLGKELDPVLEAMKAKGASKESRQAVVDYAIAVGRYKAMKGAVAAQETQMRKDKLAELEGTWGKFYQTKNEGTKWQEQSVTTAVLYDGRSVFLVSDKNNMGEYAAIDAETGEQMPVSESDISIIEDKQGNGTAAITTQSLDSYLTELIMSERKTDEDMRMEQEKANQIAGLQQRLAQEGKLNIGTSDAPVYIAYLPEQSNDGMAHFTQEDGTESILTWEQVGDYLGQPIRTLTDAQMHEAEAAALEAEEAERRAEKAQTNEQVDEADETAEEAAQSVQNAAPVHIPMNPDGTVNTDLFWDQNPEEWAKWNDGQRQDGGADSMAQIAAGMQTAEAKLAEASKLPFATPTQREARDKEMGFWQDKINRYNAMLEQYQLAEAAKETEKARTYAAERLAEAEAVLADKQKKAPKRSDYRFTPQYMQAKQKFDAEVAALQEEVTRWQNELAQYGEMPVQQEEVAPAENVSVVEEQQPEVVAPTKEELADQLDDMLAAGASRSDEAVVASMQAYADSIASGVPVKIVTRRNVVQVLKEAGVSETKIAEVKDALRRIQYIVNGFEANGVAYIMADSVMAADHLRNTYVHERQHVMTAQSGLAAALMAMTTREELQDLVAKIVRSGFYGGKSHMVLADELISMAMERGYNGEGIEDFFEDLGYENRKVIEFIKSIDNAQRNDSGLSLARVAEIGGNTAEGGSRQDGRTALSGSTEVGEQGPRPDGGVGETAGDNASRRGVGFSVSPNEGVAEATEILDKKGLGVDESTAKGEDVRFSAIKEVNAQFNQRLAELEADPTQKDRVLHLGRPSVFLMRGGVRDAEILLEYDKFVRKSAETYKSDHPFTAKDITDLPLAIYAPIASFNSTNGREQIILTELKKDGNNFVVVVRATRHPRKGGAILEVNDIQTLYPKKAKGIINWILTGKTTQMDTEKALNWIGALQTHLGTELSQQELSTAAKVVKDFVNPNLMITPEQDKAYKDAVEAGDMETAQRMVLEAAKLAMPNTKVVDKNGNPKVVYHGTGSQFYTFRETSDSNELGAGYYFSDSYEMAERYATDETLADNRFRAEALAFDIFTDEMGHSEEDYDDNEFIDDYNESYTQAVERLFGNGHVKSVFLNLENPRIMSRNSESFNPTYRHGYNHYNEGVMAKRFNDGIIDEMFEERHEGLTGTQYVAFNPSQIKSAEPVTYDDAGNVIPLSERFNPENEDIRFSVLDTTKAELKDKPIKLNGLYRFYVKSAFKGVKGADGSFPYLKAQINEVSDGYKGPAFFFDGILEGFAVIYVPKGTVSKGEKDNEFFVDPKAIESQLWDVLKSAENYYEFKYAKGPYAHGDNWLNAEGNVLFSVSRGSLVGMHNISEEKLRKVIKQGGSANPSTAVIDIERQAFGSYGEISLIMPSSLVDAETGRNAGTFTADAWTPTYPQIEKIFSVDELQRAYWRDITAIPEEMQHEVRMAFDSWLDNRTASGLAYMFLQERGEAPEMVRVAAKFPQEIKDKMSAILGEGRTGFYELTDEEKQAVLDLYIQENFGGSREDFDSSIAETIQRIEDRLSTGKVPSFVEKRITADLQWMKEHGYNYDNISNFVRDIVSDIRHAGEVNDAATTNRALDYIKDNNLSAEYEQWKESLNDRYGIKEYLFAGYTPSGNPRWLPNTVENASKLMNKQGLAGATGMASSFNRFVATLAPKKKSLSDIRSSKDLLVEDKKLVDDFRDKWSEVFFDLGIKCQPDAKGYEDYGLERLTEAAQKKNPGAYLKKEYGVELSQEDLQRLADMIKAIKTEFPARYFETKFQRPVYLNEFAAAVIPTTTSADIKQAIAEAGLPIFEYDSSAGGARREATLKATDIEGVRFSVIGELGAAADKTPEGVTRYANLAVARQMESELKPDWSAKENEAALKIKMATGWERGADGKWRYETSDIQMKPIEDWLFNKKKMTLKDIVEPGMLLELYPDLGDVVIKKNKAILDNGAWYNDATNEMQLPFAFMRRVHELAPTSEAWAQRLKEWTKDLKESIIHETQHYIQDKEGFARGGNESIVIDPAARAMIDEYLTEMDKFLKVYDSLAASDKSQSYGRFLLNQYDTYGKKVQDIMKKFGIGREGYMKLGGEVESRNTETRASMTAEERRNSLLASTEDVAREDQILINNDFRLMESEIRFSAQLDPAVRAEMDVIKATAMVNGNYMKAPNRQPTKLTEDQWALVRTKNFKNWFGDWENDPENASKVVDENGEPLVVYHGGSSTFTKFDTSLGDGMTDLGQGSYFSSNEEVAREYTVPNGDNQWQIDNYIEEHPYLRELSRTQLGLAEAERIAIDEVFKNAKLYPVFLNLRNPYLTKMEDFRNGDFVYLYNREGLRGYDGIIDNTFKERFEEFPRGAVQYVAFEPSQIKSATETTGLFSESEDIRFSVGDFGEIYEQFRGKPKEAIAFLMEKQSGEAVGALYHPEIGEIDLVWGEAGTGKSDGYGLAKLVKFHPEVIDNLQEILSEMQIVKQSANRINLESDKYQAAVRLTWNNKAKKWLLTAFEKKNSALDNTTDTGETSNGSKQNDTATLQSTVSDSKGTNNFESASESGENIAFSVRENGTMFPVSERPVDEIVYDGVQKVSEEGKKAKASLKQRLDDIDSKLYYVMRLIASAQKRYDKKTVDIMTNLAKELLRDGALSDMTRGEINRMLAAIKNATGKADLTDSANRLMDLMVSNQLRHAKNTFAQMLKIKASKVNASGVEAQGTLDVVGQRLIATVSDAVKLDLAQIDDRIAEAKEKMDSDSETIRKNAEIDLAALEIARKYVDGVAASEKEESDLRHELESAIEDKKAGKMTAEGLREFRKATEDAIRENRIQRTSAYRSLLGEMAKMITESVTRAGEFRNAEKERIERIHHYANSDLEGLPADAHTMKESAFWNSNIVRFFLKPLSSFEQWMKKLGGKNAEGKGYLYNHFIPGWVEATNKEFSGTMEAYSQLDAKVREVFGGKVKRWSDLFAMEKKLHKMTVKMWDDNKMKEFELSQGNLLYIYMVNKMTDGKMKLRRMGITEEDVRNIYNNLDPRFIELAEWIQNDFLPSLRDKYNAVHERMFGAPMAAIDNYFPIRVLANARTREVEVGTPEGNSNPSTITGNIIKRTKNSLALDVLGSDAFDVVLEHIQQMEHWAAFAEWNRDLNTLLSYKKFRNRVQNMSGIYGAGAKAWEEFRASAEIAAGVYKPKVSAMDKILNKVVRGLTAGKIGFRLWTAMKQILSAPAFAPYTSPATMLKNMAMPKSSWEWAMENLEGFRKRWKSRDMGNVRLKKNATGIERWTDDWMDTMTRVGMTPNAFVDALTCAIGAKSVYETAYAKYEGQGYPAEEARRKALVDATVAFNTTQQSGEGAFLSSLQADRDMAAYMTTTYRNANFGMGREFFDAARNLKHRMTPGYKAESIAFMTKQMMRDGLSEANAKRAAERIYRNGIFKDSARVVTFGFALQFLWNMGSSLVYQLFGDDDEQKQKMIEDAAFRAFFGPIENLTLGNVILDGVMMAKEGDISKFNPSLSPAGQDLTRLIETLSTDPIAGVSDLVNIIVQTMVGTNPQVAMDAALAIYDACNGDMETSKEVGVALLRILQAPQSQIDKIIEDEIDFTKDKGLDLTIEEFARRYAEYKHKRNAAWTFYLYSDEEEKKKEDRYIKRFIKRAEELKRTRGNEEAKAWYDYVDNEYKEIGQTLNELREGYESSVKRGDNVSAYEFAQKLQELMQTPEYKKYKEMEGGVKAAEKLRQSMKDYPQRRDEFEDKMLEIRKQLVEELQKAE